MQRHHKPRDLPEASAFGGISRRLFLTATGAAAALPAAALATPQDHAADIVDLTDEQRLDDCIAQLRAALQQMYPNVDAAGVRMRLTPKGDGYDFRIAGYAPPHCAWNGDGLYEIQAGETAGAGVYFVERAWSHMDGAWIYRAELANPDDIHPARASTEEWQLCRKLEGGAA